MLLISVNAYSLSSLSVCNVINVVKIYSIKLHIKNTCIQKTYSVLIFWVSFSQGRVIGNPSNRECLHPYTQQGHTACNGIGIARYDGGKKKKDKKQREKMHSLS